MNALLLIWIGILFVFIAELVRRDAIHEDVPPKTAWYIGLIFGGFS